MISGTRIRIAFDAWAFGWLASSALLIPSARGWLCVASLFAFVECIQALKKKEGE